MYLADFGLAKVLTESGTTTSSTRMAGTPGFQAPEQLQGGKLSPKCDVYALGGQSYLDVNPYGLRCLHIVSWFEL